jgi:hypothetical protein
MPCEVVPLRVDFSNMAAVFLQNFMKFDERNQFFLNPPFFVSMATAAKFVQPITIADAFET